ncbi:protein of unknown function [Cupriavidus taiwanensis]|nr:protein of unknown function [Cupriavidus taiwanensis]
MVAGVVFAAHPAVDAGVAQPRRQFGAQQQVVDAQAGIGLPVPAEVIPEGVDRRVGMVLAQRIGPALRQQACVGIAAFRLQQGILAPGTRVVDVLVGRHHVVVTGQHHRVAAVEEFLRMRDQPFEPGELVVELRPRLRVAVRQVKAADQHACDRRLEVAAVAVVGVAGQAAAHFDRLRAARQDGDAVPGLLAVPDRAIAGVADLARRKALVGGLQFLQAYDVRRFAREPVAQRPHPAADAVDVESGDLQRGRGHAGWAMTGCKKKPAEGSAGCSPYARQVLPLGLVVLPPVVVLPVVPAALPALLVLAAPAALVALLAPPDDSPGRSLSRRTRISLLTSLTP